MNQCQKLSKKRHSIFSEDIQCLHLNCSPMDPIKLLFIFIRYGLEKKIYYQHQNCYKTLYFFLMFHTLHNYEAYDIRI